MYRIGKQFRFEAAHSLPRLPEGHKCKRLHGHSYVVEVQIQAESLDAKGFVVDYAALDVFKKWLDENLDHRFLNDVFAFDTTAENIARGLIGVVKESLPMDHSRNMQLCKIVVRETGNTSAEYVPEDYNP